MAEPMLVIPWWDISICESESLTHGEKALGVNKTVGLLFCKKGGASPVQVSSVLNSHGRLTLHPRL